VWIFDLKGKKKILFPFYPILFPIFEDHLGMWQILPDCSKPGVLGALVDHLRMCDSMTRNISPSAEKNWVGPLMMNSYKEAEAGVTTQLDS